MIDTESVNLVAVFISQIVTTAELYGKLQGMQEVFGRSFLEAV